MLAGSEIVELAIQIEINGRDFYNALAEKSKVAGAQRVFRYLAGEEEKHIEKFKTILESLQRYEPKEAYTDEYFAYMNSLAEGCIFTQKDRGAASAKNTKNEIEAVDLAVRFEEDSVSFYGGMKKLVPDSDKKILDELIAQENGHIETLAELRTNLERKEK